MGLRKTALGLILVAPLAGCSIPGFGGGAVETVPCPARLVTLDLDERPVEPARGEGQYADMETYLVDLNLYADGLEREKAAREEQVEECDDLTG